MAVYGRTTLRELSPPLKSASNLKCVPLAAKNVLRFPILESVGTIRILLSPIVPCALVMSEVIDSYVVRYKRSNSNICMHGTARARQGSQLTLLPTLDAGRTTAAI